MLRSGLESAREPSAFDSPVSGAPVVSRVAAAAHNRRASKLRVAILAAAFFLLVSWALACCVAWSQAPAFEEMPASAALLADKKKQGELKAMVGRVLVGTDQLEPNRVNFEAWYRAFVFPQMTHLDKLPQLSDNRELLLKNDLALAKNEEARQLLVRIAFEEMKKIAAGNYHPGARYNAMLIIGELNQTEGVASSAATSRPPRPLPGALQTLLEEWKKPGASDAMTVACLLGLRRHVDVDRVLPAEQKMDTAAKKQVYDGAMALLKSKAPETRKPLAHAYLQMLATDILAYVGDPGGNGETIAALDAVLDDPASPDFLKSAAMSAIGDLNLQPVYADQAPALLRSFAEASFGFLLHEIEALNAEKQYRVDFVTKPVQGGAGSGYESMMPSSYGMSGTEYGSSYGSGGMMGPDGLPIDANKPRPGPLAKERDYVLENSRRRLKNYMIEAQRALRGRNPQAPAGLSKLAAKPEEQEIVKAFDSELDDVIDSTQDPELTIVQLIEELTARSAAMQTALGVVPPAAVDPSAAATAAATADAAPAAAETEGAAPAATAPRAAGGRGPGARGAGGRGPGGRGPAARGPGAAGPEAGGPAATEGAPAPAEGPDAEAPAGEEGAAPAEETPATEPAAP